MPQPSVCGSATKRSTAAAIAAAPSSSPASRHSLSSSATFRAISPLQREVGMIRPKRSVPQVPAASNSAARTMAASAAAFSLPFVLRASGDPSSSPSAKLAGSATGPSSAHSRQMDTCEWPAFSPMECSPEQTRSMSSKSSLPRAAMAMPSSWKRPALKSMSCSSNLYRSVVVMIFCVGTKGKFVMEPLPVMKKITLQPDATCPAMDSRSFPGESRK
mmetsp:Transcript_17719/g.45672  ORF Transcript_17719/g.45672 Transcript_17719/m.45672 type:complete len:217 (-) Transcript_17719:197-847(-)